MAAHDPTALLEKLKLALPDSVILHFARTCGFCQRDAKLDLVVFVWTLILGWSAGAKRSLAGLARAYQRHTGSTYTRSAFYRRFDASLLTLMKSLYAFQLERMPTTALGPFDQILALDAAIVRLWDGLVGTFESTQDGQAALKMQFVLGVADMSANQLKVHSARPHEISRWRHMGPWVRGCLLLMDLGYDSFWHFHNIGSHGGYFLSRVKAGCALHIVEDLTGGPGRRARVEGLEVHEALEKLRGQGAHWLVEVPVTLRSGRIQTYHWRMIVERNEDTGRYHAYLTNAPETLISCEDARPLYALRWQVELAIKGLRSVGRLHQLPTSKSEIVEVLIRAALLFLLLSGWLRHQLFGLQKLWRAGMLRTLTVMAEWADTMLKLVATQSEVFERRCMLEMLREQIRDPNHVRERAFAIAPIVEYSCGQAP